ncbi:MAG: hypothetical protein R2805_05835 [Flavobacterium sp.]
MSSQTSYAVGILITGAMFTVIVAIPVCGCEHAGVEALDTLISS